MKLDGQWSDLETRGFLVVRDLVPPDVLRAAQDLARAKETSLPAAIDPDRDRRKASIMSSQLAPRALYELLAPHVQETFDAVSKHTAIRVDSTFPLLRWFRPGVGILHTDTNPYYMFQDFSDYLNYWFPIFKARPDQTGMAFVPMDVLEAEEPELYAATEGIGGVIPYPRSIVEKGMDAVREAMRNPDIRDAAEAAPDASDGFLVTRPDGEFLAIAPRNDLHEYLVAPDVGEGDVVISRGDCIHKTQDTLDADRLSVSLRAFNGQRVVTRSFLEGLPDQVRAYMVNPRGPMLPFVAAFEHLGSELTTNELCGFVMGVLDGEPEARSAFESIVPRADTLLQPPA